MSKKTATALTPQQSRAIRAWLGWSQEELARQADCGVRTVMDFERGARETATGSLSLLIRAFERAGGITLEPDGGLKLAPKGKK